MVRKKGKYYRKPILADSLESLWRSYQQYAENMGALRSKRNAMMWADYKSSVDKIIEQMENTKKKIEEKIRQDAREQFESERIDTEADILVDHLHHDVSIHSDNGSYGSDMSNSVST